jgi:hypothetical protein
MGVLTKTHPMRTTRATRQSLYIEKVEELTQLREAPQQDGYTQVLLLHTYKQGTR